jgi:hypothetical protein
MKKYQYQLTSIAIIVGSGIQLYATVTVENQSAVPVRITQVTLWQSQGLEQLPIPHTKNIIIEPGQQIAHTSLTDGQDVPIIEITLNINNVPYQFTLAHDDQQHNSIRITPELKVQLDGNIQRMRPTSALRYALPAGVYAV